MAQWVRTCVVLSEDTRSVLSTQVGWLTASRNASSRGFSSGLLRHAHTHIIKN